MVLTFQIIFFLFIYLILVKHFLGHEMNVYSIEEKRRKKTKQNDIFLDVYSTF